MSTKKTLTDGGAEILSRLKSERISEAPSDKGLLIANELNQ